MVERSIPVRGDGSDTTLWSRLGSDWFEALVERFYAGVIDDPVLRPMYPEDLTESRAHLTQFLVQYWGGPTTYSEARGHPRLRMRHAPFVIDDAARASWLEHMTAAVRAGAAEPEDEQALLDYFAMAAQHLVNTAG